ncbi:MAG TPA: serpin family protein [Bacillota bacterium]|nr:serpin family protein [Bacillota bacterium]HQE01249.1 serpin family protein [Bacillota bacterium]
MKSRRALLSSALCLLLLTAAATNLAACTDRVRAADLMLDITAQKVEGRSADARFIGNVAEFSLRLFRKSADPGQSSLVSPLSVLLALAMTANGANAATLSEMEAVLGGDIPLDELNEYLYAYEISLPSEQKAKMSIANSIWFRDDEDRLQVERDFLQTNADYYGAAAYKAPFDQRTLKDINNWVKANTDGLIDKILDEIRDDAVMYLLNAMVFDAEWKEIYSKNSIYQGEFTAADGSRQAAEFMFSEETWYLDDGKATGFIKPYAGDKYSFVALLPNEGIEVRDYLAGLSGENFLRIINEAREIAVNANMPKFSCAYTVELNDCLKEMGMPAAFSAAQADFSRLGRSSRGNIFIGEVLHKTYIAVDERGTKAGAVTKVEMRDEAYIETRTVTLNRPFVYAIIDNSSKLPLFLGTVLEIESK